MPRRAAAQIRTVEPDAVYRNRLVQQVINKVMLDGKKSTAETIVYDALAILEERTGKPALEVLEAGVKALTPVLEVRSRRVGGATYRCRSRFRRGAPARWRCAGSSRSRVSAVSDDGAALANELLDAQQQQGNAFKRKDDIYRMAQANKAFAHYAG